MNMKKYFYFPLVKTRDAEMRCMENIESNIFNDMLPIYELTKSRKTLKTPDGDIYKRMERIKSIQEDRPFILDLTTNDKYINSQIESLLDETSGFEAWYHFIRQHQDCNLIPMIHIHADEQFGFREVERFVQKISAGDKYPALAVRLPYDLGRGEYSEYISPIVNSLQGSTKLFVIIDCDYMRAEAERDLEGLSDMFISAANEINEFSEKIEDIVLMSTSFPSNVASTGKGDSSGEFVIYEERLYQKICESYPENRSQLPLKYGDYASINTEQIEIKGGTFVPRIDIAIEDVFFYKRYRRDAGGYIKCAKEVMLDFRFKTDSSWASNQIVKAASGKPDGISPAYWISVRMAHYMKTRVELRRNL
ncbi:beta family protein [Shewanella litorisediminis]|uniref:Beta family protein n=1 Tax=Shewanella litorisediminis TaxID=1173586 RepID=A0ABX7G2Q6_9GAMM|nr:beta family protein [Shewanella litorisediminis]MCL2917041.1 beta family protein [Shewanella litorisediminis]QRH01522.1 beta family protein [Shewanella litorisediminis]